MSKPPFPKMRAHGAACLGRDGIGRTSAADFCRPGERQRHRPRAIRLLAEHDEERPRARTERALCATGAGCSPDLRRRLDGAAIGWAVLGDDERRAAPASHRRLRALYLGDLCRAPRQLCGTEAAGDRRAARRRCHGPQPDRQGERRARQGRLSDAQERRCGG
jgi:hypothetical protein